MKTLTHPIHGAARALAFVAIALAGCAGNQSVNQSQLYDPKALPSGPVGESIAYGHALIVQTKQLMGEYARADMQCAACHLDAGTKARGGSFVGTYARFPQWNARSHRVIALQDRIAECFLYSMNGKPPAYNSKPMIAIVAYIAWLSRKTPVGAPRPESDNFIEPLPSAPPDIARGAALYAQKCAACHQTGGQGLSGAFPPLWGASSFNRGAGMAHIDRMTGFVRYNMPQNAPGSLSLHEAYDISGYVLSRPRPRFQRSVLVVTPSRAAGFF